MRINVTGVESKKLPKWRQQARERMRFLPGKVSNAIRACVAERMQGEGLKRAFKAMGQRHKADHRKLADAVRDAKEEAIREWKSEEIEEGEIDDLDVAEMTARSTLAKVGRAGSVEVRARYQAVAYKTVIIRGKPERVPTHYRLKKLTKSKRVVLTGPRVTAGNLKRKMSGRAYWDRIRALAAALEVRGKSGKLDLIFARKLDHKMMNVPDNVRRRIYDECVEKQAAGWHGPSHLRGTELLPSSRKELRARWGAILDGHGDAKRKGRPSHRGGSGGRR
jgi:hypothetical protein